MFTDKLLVTSKVIVNPPLTLATVCITPVLAGIIPNPVDILAAVVLHVTSIPITGSRKVALGMLPTVIKAPIPPLATLVTFPVKKFSTYSLFLLTIVGLLKSSLVSIGNAVLGPSDTVTPAAVTPITVIRFVIKTLPVSF